MAATQSPEPIAIIGMAVRFPQNAKSVTTYWDMLCRAQSARTKIPEDRYNVDAYYDPDPELENSIHCKFGYFLHEDIAKFDAPFFGISAAEAACMDPQQRAMLEITYHALENERVWANTMLTAAGIPLERVKGSNASVYVASDSPLEFQSLFLHDMEEQPKHRAIGTSATMLANRISHSFDLRGESVYLDTACSGSVHCLHLACNNLRLRESSMSIVGASNMILTPDSHMVALSNGGFLSADGTCHSFDAAANGYGRAEGVGVLVLKRMSDAIRDGDNVRSVIRASGLSSDGRTPSISQPNGLAQELLINRVYDIAKLDKAETHFIEAHGTGTPVGDPIEAKAIGNAFRDSRKEHENILVGALKANFGHMEAASGLAAIVKVTLMLETGLIPPNIHLQRINPDIDHEKLSLEFPTKLMRWPPQNVRRASINNFGVGGTNAHVILESAPAVPFVDRSYDHDKKACTPKILIFSAADKDGPSRQANELRLYASKHRLAQLDEQNLGKLCHIYNSRSHLPWRSYAVIDNIQSLDSTLQACLPAARRVGKRPSLSLLFTGQGTQWATMGRGLSSYPIFLNSLQDAENHLRKLGCSWSIFDVLKDEHTRRIDSAEYSQPLCTIIQIGLLELLASWKLRPTSAIGHSSGEIAAGFAAGFLSRESAWTLAYYRGICCTSTDTNHDELESMMAVGLSDGECSSLLFSLGLQYHLEVVCLNSPVNTTIAGLRVSLQQLKGHLDSEGVFSRMLTVDRAYHSRYMRVCGDIYRHLIKDVTPPRRNLFEDGSVKLYSTLYGRRISNETMQDPHYWAENLTQPVKFRAAIEACLDEYRSQTSLQIAFLEVGPSPALSRPLQETAAAKLGNSSASVTHTACLRRGCSESQTLLGAVGEMFLQGIVDDFDSINGAPSEIHLSQILKDLPPYPFDHSRRYWCESRISQKKRFREMRKNPLLGVSDLEFHDESALYRNVLKGKENLWLRDHVVSIHPHAKGIKFLTYQLHGSPIYPGAGCIVMVIEALQQHFFNETDIAGFLLSDISYSGTLKITVDTEGCETRLSVRAVQALSSTPGSSFEFTVTGLASNASKWVTICTGLVEALHSHSLDQIPVHHVDHECVRSKCSYEVHPAQFYENLASIGYSYGPHFQRLEAIRYSKHRTGSAFVRLKDFNSDVKSSSRPSIIDPCSLDSIFQAFLVAATNGGWDTSKTWLPTKTGKLWISSSLRHMSPGTSLHVIAENYRQGSRDYEFEASAIDCKSKKLMISIQAHIAVVLPHGFGSSTFAKVNSGEHVYTSMWQPDHRLLTKDQRIGTYAERTKHLNSPSPQGQSYMDALCLKYLKEFAKMSADQLKLNSSHLNKYLAWASKTIALTTQVPEKPFEEPLSNLTGYEHRIRMASQVQQHLPSILNGSIDPLQLLFEQGYAQKLYRECYKHFGYRAGMYLDLIAHENPAISVLEVGAGVGAMTAEILEALSLPTLHGSRLRKFASYTYTDVSQTFLVEAQTRFQAYSPTIIFKILDIAKDPILQGYKEASYDVVIASAVLHATPNLIQSLRNVRRILKPRGTFILFEHCNPGRLFETFVFGLLPGWWIGSEDFRAESPLVEESVWDNLLKTSGFSGNELVIRDFENSNDHSLSIIVSTAIDSFDTVPDKESEAAAAAILYGQGTEQQRAMEHLKDHLEQANVQVLTYRQDDFKFQIPQLRLAILLWDMEIDFLGEMDSEDFKSLKNLILSTEKIIWVTRGASFSPTRPEIAKIEGFARSMAMEHGTMFTVMSLSANLSVYDAANLIALVYQQVYKADEKDIEPQYKEENGILYICRTVPASSIQQFMLSIQQREQKLTKGISITGISHPARIVAQASSDSSGSLDSIEFVERTSSNSEYTNYPEVSVLSAYIDFDDISSALGHSREEPLGRSATGTVVQPGDMSELKQGDLVLCVCAGAVASLLRCSPDRVYKLPQDMDPHIASSLPWTAGVAYHALFETAHIQPGQTVLVLSAHTILGQYAVQMARSRGSKVFAVVPLAENHQMLTEKFDLRPSSIFIGSTESALGELKQITGRASIDVIIGSHNERLRPCHLEALAPCGHFIGIGNPLLQGKLALPASCFSRNISIKAVDFDSVIQYSNESLKRIMDWIFHMAKVHKLHWIEPSSLFKASNAVQAFKSLGKATTNGGTNIEFKTGDSIAVQRIFPKAWQFDENSTYVIAGGFGGIGRSIIRWMVSRGVRNILVISRSDWRTNHAARELKEDTEREGARLLAVQCDISDRDKLTLALTTSLPSLPPVRGCIQASMVLKDEMLSTMSLDSFRVPLPSKVQGSRNLLDCLPHDMDFMLFLSSISGFLGAMAQSNYSAANTYQDALARYATARCQKCFSLNLGLMVGFGYAAENYQVTDQLKRRGFLGVSEADLFAFLEYLCDPSKRHLPYETTDAVIGLPTPSNLSYRGKDIWPWFKKPTYRLLHNITDDRIPNDLKNEKEESNLIELIQNCDGSIQKTASMILQVVTRRLSDSVGIAEDNIDTGQAIFELGVDSLIAVELRFWLLQKFGIDIPIAKILADITLTELCEEVASGLFAKR